MDLYLIRETKRSVSFRWLAFWPSECGGMLCEELQVGESHVLCSLARTPEDSSLRVWWCAGTLPSWFCHHLSKDAVGHLKLVSLNSHWLRFLPQSPLPLDSSSVLSPRTAQPASHSEGLFRRLLQLLLITSSHTIYPLAHQKSWNSVKPFISLLKKKDSIKLWY